MPAICKLAIFVALAIFPSLSRAANITLQGNFTADDNIQLFSVSIAAPAAVDIRSYGYAGGTTSTGAVVPRGGFDTILTLFNASGVFIDDNDDGAGVAVDPATGLTGDARITANLATGSYIVALTQYDNFSIGDLADGFAETGHPNFTADPAFATGGACAGNMFRDISGTDGRCRTGNWAVDFLNVSSVTPVAVPEPSALLIAGLGLGLLLVSRFKQRTKATVLAGALVVTLTAVAARAQTSSGPDYNNVSDILNGQRSLLQVTDLMVSIYGQSLGHVYSTPITTSNSQQTLQNRFDWFTQGQSGGPSFSALMWNGGNATTITVVYGDVANSAQQAGLDLLFQTGTNTVNWTNAYPFGVGTGSNPGITSGAAGDFTGDGFDDLALSTDDGRLLIITANDVNNPAASIRGGATPVDTLSAIAAGDFKGDGNREIAGLAIQPDGSLKLEIYTVDPNSLAVTLASSITLRDVGSPVAHVSMARGRFASVNHDQLAVAFAGSGPAFVEVIDFTPNTLIPHEASATLGNPAPNVAINGYIQVLTGKFHLPSNSYDSIVYHSSSGNTLGRFFEILTVDTSNYNVGGTVPVTYDEFPCALGIQVGNFDHRQGTDPNLNSQIAFMYCNSESDDSNNPGFTINIYSVDPTTSNINGNADSAIDLTGLLAPDNSKPGIPSFVASDLQGRSLTLGEPKVIDIDNMDQPTVVVGSPPMHVDFVSPDGTSAPQLLNLSAVPRGFNDTYNSQSSDQNPQSTSHTSSWSWGAEESFGAKVVVGDLKGGSGYSVGDKFTAAQQLSGSIDFTNGTFSAKTYGLSSTTGLSDYVTHNETILRVWVYPVIGQMVCPSGKTCPPDAQVPLTIQFSAPLTDNNPISEAGSNLSWYQPPWEPGNILSYPANLTQLQNMYQGQGTCPGGTTSQNTTLCTLASGDSFRTDDISLTETTQWQIASTTSTATSFNQNYSFDNDLSVAGSIGKAGVAQAQFTGDFDVSGSFGLSALTNNSTTLALSTGLEVKKPGSFPSPTTYGYYVTPYILGSTVPGGVVDNKPLNQGVQTFGVMRAVFTADPFLEGQSTWWNQIYSQAPDVALNHPVRWNVKNMTPIPGSTCIVVPGLNSDCVSLATPKDPSNPGLDSFHQMRGFFISTTIRDPNSNSCNATGGQGPQLESATAGDCLYLQARVYNYSLKAMDPGTQVHVRFYFTPWGDDSRPAGDSVLIADVPAGQLIPPFDDTEVNGQAAPPDWILVPAQFDLNKFEYTQNGNVNIRFWAVVWMEDGNGNLVGEMPGHGLTGIPGTLTSLADAAKLEECQSDGSCYSNNVGFYNQTFYIYPPKNLLGGPAPLPRAPVGISKLETSVHQVTPGDNVILSATLLAGGGAASGASVYFYDGDPKQDGQVFASERIPHIAADTPHQIQAVYRSNACGVHELFAVINRGQPSEVVRRAHPVRVDCKVNH
jgi:hypothetical protein